MDKLIPGESLIYERANGVVYARYRDPPHNSIPRWVVGGEPEAVENLKYEKNHQSIFIVLYTNTK